MVFKRFIIPALFQLTQRPLKLSLVPEDKFPTDRLASAAVASQDIKTVENMSEMAQFVYERFHKCKHYHHSRQAPLATSAPG